MIQGVVAELAGRFFPFHHVAPGLDDRGIIGELDGVNLDSAIRRPRTGLTHALEISFRIEAKLVAGIEISQDSNFALKHLLKLGLQNSMISRLRSCNRQEQAKQR